MDNSDKLTGKAKEVAGKAMDDEELETEGQTQHMKGEMKDKADDAKDAARGAMKGLKDD